ncbi:hypothetical protein DUI87_03362 [Hirundo rustica rustica]|uniref:RNase H type-1 domain-containing protein n=1 Tax=Hirundo rustica rustica TaxID=333673 RepID=A0A3M0LKZ8_HIRRU|nr:hypothetical protein DUI87_03362 [Hirundo rustica rustica]
MCVCPRTLGHAGYLQSVSVLTCDHRGRIQLTGKVEAVINLKATKWMNPRVITLMIPPQTVAQATEGEGGSSQLAELKAVQLALDIAEREKWPKLYLYTDSWMVANALWGWLEKWKKANWQHRGKPIWAVDEWKDISTRVEKLPVKVRHVDAHVPKSRANEEHRNNEQVDQAAKIEVSKIDFD